jgi:branched-chain amino acid transport system permease protein
LSNYIKRARAVLAGPRANTILGLVVLGVVLLLVVPRVIQGGPSYLLQTIVFGAAAGALYALIALGYTMVYGIIELINFAHGDIFTLGAFISLPVLGLFGITSLSGPGGLAVIPILIAVFAIVMVINGLINVGIERVAYRPLRNSPRLAPLITAVGMSFVLEGIMYLWKGPTNVHYPDLLPPNRIQLAGGTSIAYKDLIVIALAVILVTILTLFISRSRLGKAMRATAQDRDAAQLMGIDINRTISAAFFIGASLAGAGGIIYGLYYNNLSFDLGFENGLIAFTAAVFGGIGNIQGAALGGLGIGLIRAMNDGYFSTAWTDVVLFGILIGVLVFRPTGLLGARVPEK